MSTESKLIANSKAERFIYLDIVKFIAVFLVIYAHVYPSRIYEWASSPIEMWGGLFLQCFRTCNNALFMMVSGALLLGKRESIQRIVLHRISRIVIGLLIFSLLYEFYNGNFTDVFSFFEKVWSKNVIAPLWFLYYYIGFLLILPFLRAIAQNTTIRQTKYLIILAVVYSTIFPTIRAFTGFSMPYVPLLFGDFVVMPLFGYCIHKSDIHKKDIVFWGIVFLVFEILSCVATQNQMDKIGRYTDDFISLGSYPAAIFVFLLLKYSIRKKSSKYAAITSTTFGIFYFAPWLQDKFLFIYKRFSIYITTIPAFCVYIICIMFVAAIVTYGLKKIPIIKRIF